MKSQTWRRDAAAYRQAGELWPRYADVDTLRHINNVSVHALHAEARMRWQLQQLGRDSWRSEGLMLRPLRVATDFVAESHFPDALQTGVQLLQADNSGWTLGVGLFQHQQCVGLHECRIGAWQDGRPVALPEALATRLRSSLAAAALPEGAAATLPATPAEPNPAPLAAYAAHTQVLPRYGDLDADGCVSEVALVRYIEMGRSALLTPALASPDSGAPKGWLSLLVARTEARFLRHPAPGRPLQIASGIARLGRSSLGLQVALFDADGCCVVADNVMVFTTEQGPAELPAPLRALMAARALPASG